MLFITSYAPHGVGGSAIILHNLLRYVPLRRVVFLTSRQNVKSYPLVNDPLPCPTYYFDSTPSARITRYFLYLFSHMAKLGILNQCYLALMMAIGIRKIVSTGMRLIKEQGFDSLALTTDPGLALIGGYCLARRTRLPYSIIYFDPYVGNNFGWVLNLVSMAYEPRLLRNAQNVIVCGDALETALSRRVQREYVSLPISVDVPRKPPDFVQGRPKVFRILYAGAVYWAQVDTIRSFVDAVGALGVEFLVYSHQKKEELARMGVEGSHVRYGFLAKKELLKFQHSVDLLYLPLSFRKEYKKVIEVATASKICEYMTSGRPILLHAPAYAYIVKYAVRENFAHVVTSADPEKIRQNLIMLMRDAAHRKRLAENAWRIVKTYHNAKRNSNILTDTLSLA